MKINKFISAFLLAVCCVLLISGTKAQFHLDSVRRNAEFAFISDTQSPMWIETLVIARNRNEKAARMLLDSIICDSTLSAVVHLGDVTESSANDKSWLPIDSFLTRSKSRSLPVYAAIGNHDYLFSAQKGEENFRKRFSTVPENRIYGKNRSSCICAVEFEFWPSCGLEITRSRLGILPSWIHWSAILRLRPLSSVVIIRRLRIIPSSADLRKSGNILFRCI